MLKLAWRGEAGQVMVVSRTSHSALVGIRTELWMTGASGAGWHSSAVALAEDDGSIQESSVIEQPQDAHLSVSSEV